MPVGWASPLSLVLKGGWGVGGCRWVTLPWPWTGLPSKGPQPVDLGGGQWQDLQRQIKGWHVCLDEHIHRVEFTVGNGGNHAELLMLQSLVAGISVCRWVRPAVMPRLMQQC